MYTGVKEKMKKKQVLPLSTGCEYTNGWAPDEQIRDPLQYTERYFTKVHLSLSKGGQPTLWKGVLVRWHSLCQRHVGMKWPGIWRPCKWLIKARE